MKALLYCDWCAIRGILLRVLCIGVCVMVPCVVMSSDMGIDAAVAFGGPVVATMMTFYIMLGIFGADEQGGWEHVRLSLPVTSRDVVRARYACIALGSIASALVASVASMVLGVVLLLLDASNAALDLLAIVGASLGAAVGALAYLSLLMPVVFKAGLSKGRIFFSLPFLLIMMLNFEPVGKAARSLVAGLEEASAALGSAVPLVVAGLAATSVLYVASMLLSERLYAARDF